MHFDPRRRGLNYAALAGGDPIISLGGVVGLWYMDQYQSSPRPYVPNAMSSVAVSANLFAAPRRLFANTSWWSCLNSAAVDNVATGPDGATEASTLISSSGAWSIAVADVTNLPAGTYTVACNVKRNTGTDQSFGFSSDNTATRVTSVTVDGVSSQPATATATWKRFAHTFVLAAPAAINRIRLCSSDGVTQASLQICNLELYAGSADLGPQALGGHLYLGYSAVGSLPTYSGGKLDFSTGPGLAQFSSPASVSSWTVSAVVRRSSGGNFQGILSRVKSYAQFSATTDISGVPSRADSNAYDNAAGLFNLVGKGWSVITHRYDVTGTRHDLFIGNVKLAGASASLAAFTVDELAVGYINAILSKLEVSQIAFFNRALSDAEVCG